MSDKADDGRISALMMLAGGVDPRDVARLLKVRPEVIRAWMAQPPREWRDKGAED